MPDEGTAILQLSIVSRTSTIHGEIYLDNTSILMEYLHEILYNFLI